MRYLSMTLEDSLHIDLHLWYPFCTKLLKTYICGNRIAYIFSAIVL